MIGFQSQINELSKLDFWQSCEFSGGKNLVLFFNNTDTIDFVVFEGDDLLIDASFNKITKILSYKEGKLLDLTKELEEAQKHTNIIERIDIVFSSTRLVNLLNTEETVNQIKAYKP